MMSDKDNNLLKSDILTVGSELSEKLNAIGVPNTFGKASEGKDNLMSIIRMTINGLDMTIDQIREILRDYYNKSEINTLLNGKSDTSHNHDSAYANISHNHDNAYASKSHQHDGVDVILSNNNNVDSEITSLKNSSTNTSKEILENDDLNDYSEIGFYYCPYRSVAQTLSNCPVTNAFALFVEKYSGYENACTQTVTTYDGTRLLKFIRTFQTLDGEFQHSDWLPLYDDTGWQTISWASNFTTYSTGKEPKVRRIGNIVQLEGWAKNTTSMTIDADNLKTMFTLPEQFRPVRSYTFVCQGSSMAIYDLNVNPNGTVQVSRYRQTSSSSTSYSSVGAGQWLPFSVVYMV